MASDHLDGTAGSSSTVFCTNCERATDVRHSSSFVDWRGGRVTTVHRLCRDCAAQWDDGLQPPGGPR